MHYEFTAAALRALQTAAHCAPAGSDGQWRLPEMLLALAVEPECRAAALLTAQGVDEAKVRQQWPDLTLPQMNGNHNGHGEPDPPTFFAREVRNALRTISARLGHLEPFVVATDHLLLGLVESTGEVGRWLAEQGFDRAALDSHLQAVYGLHDAPLSVEDSAEGNGSPISLEMPADDDDWLPAAQQEPTTSTETNESFQSMALSPDIAPLIRAPLGSGDIAVLRVIDAAGNRAREALRVLEDYVRFVLDDRHLTDTVKSLRHELAEELRKIPLGDLLAARDTPHDVGTELSTAGEGRRRSSADIATANFKRAQEALRSLEEFSKLRDPALAATIKQLRYRAYTLERAVRTTGRRGSLADARLYVLLDGRSSADEFCQLAENLVAAGVDVVQLRDKSLDDRTLLARARQLRDITATSRTLFIMNDRPDLAVLAEADGVHVGQEEMPVAAARAIVGGGSLVGVSTHSLEQARQAVLDGADYLGIGPVFPSGTKSFERYVGVDIAAAVCREIRLPAFAIGGINDQNLPDLLAAGCRRVAVAGAVVCVPEPEIAVRRLRALLG